ncbi:MAG: hypothetical protein ACOYOJ_03910 [Alsobacter sp.]
MLLDSGFVQKKPATAAQVAGLNGLPPNQIVKQTVQGKTNYLFADPAGCNCLHVGDEDAMQNVMMQMNQQMPGQSNPAIPNIGPDAIGDLGGWSSM